ncbi:MAG: hypothetical protein HYY64_18175 [Candidatus Rokubacteria bacterium]|nr:hypothetical protein [Candidatus Rokubacteria bacterium]
MGLALAFVWFLLARVAHAGEEFPSFLPGADQFPPDVRSEIISVWTDYTLTRVVAGRPARAPLEIYRLFVDHPDVTAAASRHLGLAKYRVEPVGPDRFAADDGEGAKGTYRVLVHDDRRRIMLTRGSHEGRILGRIGGASLTILSFELRAGSEGAPEVAQQVESFVRIDNPVAAFFARLLLPLFSGYADRKIAETFDVTARVSEWAAREPTAFCAWLAGSDGLPARRVSFSSLCR